MTEHDETDPSRVEELKMRIGLAFVRLLLRLGLIKNDRKWNEP